MKFFKIFLIVAAAASFYFPQQKESYEIIFMPDGLNFLPLRANMHEAKLGVLWYPKNGNLKVDIGNTIDLIGVKYPASYLTAGVEFMAFADVIGYEQLRLQINAVDGFFGGNFSYTIFEEEKKFAFRFRFIHNSAHLVDGNWWTTEYPRKWAKPNGPIPFTRDYAELLASELLPAFNSQLRYYGAVSYSFKIRPQELKQLNFSAGFEIHNDKIFSEGLFNRPIYLFLAHHLSIAGYPKYTASSHSQLGIKFGKYESKGILFYFSLYNGNNFFSEFYDQRVTNLGFGFAIDFP